MLSEEEKLKLKIFLINELHWSDLSFCISDEKSVGKLFTKIFIEPIVEIQELIKLKEYLQCEKLYIKTIQKQNHNLMIWWI